jgi:predicted GH43/DUF377 family glycosyl hydrolase
MIKKILVSICIAGVCFYAAAIHRSRELPAAVIEQGVAVIDKIEEIKLSGYKTYNPGVIALKEGYLLVSREKAPSFFDYIKLKCLRKRRNIITLSELDEHFKQVGVSTQLIPCDGDGMNKVTDPRLFIHEGEIFMVFCDHSHGGSVQTLCQLKKENGRWAAYGIIPLCFEGSDEFTSKNLVSKGIEKNWMPFSLDGKLYMVYLIEPEKVVVDVNIKSGKCSLVSRTPNRFTDLFTPLRGGAPPVYDEELGEFITIYHVAFPGRNSYTTIKKNVYICGAYTFTADMPFSVTGKCSGPFYQEELYDNREKIIFATALIRKGDYYLMFYGEDDCRIKVAKIDRRLLINAIQRG